MVKLTKRALTKPFKHLNKRLKARLKREVYRRDNYKCVYCGCDMLSSLELFHFRTMDHITPQSKGGTNDPSNLCCCCHTCNSIKSDFEATSVEEVQEYLASKINEIRELYEEERRRFRKPWYRRLLCLITGF